MSIMEVMVAIAIGLILMAVLAPAGRSLLELDQRGAGRKLAVTFERLHDEAMMRNLSFRLVFFLDQGKYVIEAGEPGALISASPEERAEFDREMRDKEEAMKRLGDDAYRAWMRSRRQAFETKGKREQTEVELPSGVKIGGVYTPQYGKMVLPGDDLGDKLNKDDPDKVYSYIMNNGFTEHTLVWLVKASDPSDGWTVEVEPLSGIVRLHGELIDVRDIQQQIPDEGPDLPN
ncbi:MAG TPA: hypothetical protein ENK18_07425 [Deltaproteobacteria bacterium]|nr:hypothetical protein [Deltaproteobacteria bacterium]